MNIIYLHKKTMSHDKIHFSFKEKKKKKLLINEYLSTGGGSTLTCAFTGRSIITRGQKVLPQVWSCFHLTLRESGLL